MKAFAGLYADLDATTSTRRKVEAMRDWLRAADPADAAWATYFLAGGKPRQLVPVRRLREAACRAAQVPDWLFEECYQAVGDLAETIAHLLPPPLSDEPLGLDAWMRERLLPLRGQPAEAIDAALLEWWQRLDAGSRFVANKLVTGGLRVGVSRLLVQRALAEAFDLSPALLAQRLIGWTDADVQPDAARFAALVAPAGDDASPAAAPDDGRPYPFFLAQSLQPAAGTSPEATLGPAADWLAEWKWDGIRGQLVRRGDGAWLWSRGEELVTERFPELAAAARALPAGTVLDGEILAWDEAAARPATFQALQRRLGRRTVGATLLREVPVVFVAYDLLESEGVDRRGEPQVQRRERLEAVLAPAQAGGLRLSARLSATDWVQLAQLRLQARAQGAEGLMLKRLDAAYGIGRTKADARGQWWKWKLDPLSVDAVLVYAQRGHGRRASLYTDYTFAVWSDGPARPDRTLVPFAKAYSGLDDAQIRAVDAVIRRTTVEKFGPVRSVEPTLVFELGFEGIGRSPRHRSGIAVRFPRMLRWRVDKPVAEADTLAALRALLPEAGDG